MVSTVRLLAGDFGENVPALLLTTFGECTLSVPSPHGEQEQITLRGEVVSAVRIDSEEAAKELPARWQQVLRQSHQPLARHDGRNVIVAVKLKDGRSFLGMTNRKSLQAFERACAQG